MFTPNVVCIGVSLKSWFSTTWSSASFFSSTTTRMPRRSDSSRTSEIPSTRPSRTSSAIFSIIEALLTMYGISSTTMRRLPPRASSTSARARTVSRPRPVRYASRICAEPWMRAAVGKSGPGSFSIRSSSEARGLRASRTSASTVSPMLCGGMFVAMPTAMPDEPFTIRFGSRVGSTSGSVRVLS